MLTISNKATQFGAALMFRLMIFLFCYLATEFGRSFIMVGVEHHPLMAMWGNVSFEITALLIFNLLYSHTSVGRDINTLNFYGIALHLIYLPFYYQGIDLSAYHNNAIKGLNALIALRTFFPFDLDLLARIAVVEYAKKWFHTNRLFFSKYVNGLTISLFLVCALPLFTFIYFINTDQMRITGIAIVLLAFFIAFEHSAKAQKRQVRSAQALPEVIEPASKENGGVERITLDKFTVDILRAVWKILLCLLVLASVMAIALGTDGKKDSFRFGYAAGYQDGKSGAKPKSSVRYGKMLYCFLVYNPQESRDFGKGPHECEPEHFDE